MLTHLKLKNFTAFTEADFEFCEGLNVIIGENGTGKTHVLKAAYAAISMSAFNDNGKRSPNEVAWVVKTKKLTQ
jgi:predicted ATP-dependent endonuclease of OLD family